MQYYFNLMTHIYIIIKTDCFSCEKRNRRSVRTHPEKSKFNRPKLKTSENKLNMNSIQNEKKNSVNQI